jgi:predicted DNA-binding transcriptional regulator YafY
MRRAERLFRLVNEMRARGHCRADDLACALEVSRRTVYRDIAHLQGSGLPIEGEAGVGYVLRPGFSLPSLTFTHEQLDALAVALSFAERVDDPGLAQAAREVRAKLQASLPEPELRRLAEAPYFSFPRQTGAADHAARLRAAIRQRRLVWLAYVDGAGVASERRLRPLAVLTFEMGWMVSGWCELRGDFRSFRLDRIHGLEVLEERFAPDEAKSLRAFLEREACAAR